MILRVPCGWLEPAVRNAAQGGGMDIETAYALLAEVELREVEELDAGWFEAELTAYLPLA